MNDYRMGWPAAMINSDDGEEEPAQKMIWPRKPFPLGIPERAWVEPRARGEAAVQELHRLRDFETNDMTYIARRIVAEPINGAAQADKPAQHGAESGSVDDPVAAPPLPDGWIEHDGGCCPVPPGTPVEVRLRKGSVHKGRALIDCPLNESQWIAEPPGMDRDYMRVLDITHYRIVSKA